MEKWEEFIEAAKLPRQDQKVYIWGAGNTSSLNRQGMLRAGLYQALRVEGFIDSYRAGTQFHGFPVHSPDALAAVDPDAVFLLISTTNNRVYAEIEALCAARGYACALMDAAILKLRREAFIEAAGLLDPDSQEIYHHILFNRAMANDDYDTLYGGENYFGIPAFCRPSINDVVVDCGAYVGEGAERFIWRMDKFRRYIAIEPDAGNYRAMCRRFDRLNAEWNLPEGKLAALYAGVDETSHTGSIETRVDGLGSIAVESAGPTEETVPFWAIDDLMTERFTFLKADIESYEYRMLLGARRSIQAYKPRLAICIYHNMSDMYDIPLLVNRINPSYRLSIRHHSYGYEETVLYAYE